MKSKATLYYSLFFCFCLLASMITGSYLNANTPVAKSDFKHYKPVSLTDKEKNSTNSDFLFEENENENDIKSDLKLWTNPLSDFVTHFQLETIQPILQHSPVITEKQINPIYILICDFRI